MSSDAASWIVLAHLLRPQGRKGELLAELLTDFPDRLAGRESLFLAPPQFRGAPHEARQIIVVSSWLPVGKNKGRIVLELAGINSISAAESLTGLDLVVPEDSRAPLEDGSAYISDLTGCTVYDRDTPIGEVTGVEFPSSPDGIPLDDVPSLLEVQSSEGHEILIPYAKAFLISVDLDAKKIVLQLPSGLVDINR